MLSRSCCCCWMAYCWMASKPGSRGWAEPGETAPAEVANSAPVNACCWCSCKAELQSAPVCSSCWCNWCTACWCHPGNTGTPGTLSLAPSCSSVATCGLTASTGASLWLEPCRWMGPPVAWL
uniref:Uncharacterized protein n=1 Tax=Ixodes ricinus TaxID=34613 RepID=A0A6B0UN69_IXORI